MLLHPDLIKKWEVMIVLKLSLVSGRRTFFGRGNEIHYIGGTEILPAPLDTAEEQKNDPYVRNCQ